MALNLFEETTALLADLERHGVPYAVAGALALAIHGVPRATTDIDLLVRREDVEATLRVAVARGFSVQAPPMRCSDGLEVRRSSKVEAAEMLTLDLLLVNENLEPVWASRERVSTEGGELWVVSRGGADRHEGLGRPRAGLGRHPAPARARPVTPRGMSPGAVSQRLRESSDRSDLTAARRLATKVDMSPAAVTRRLRTQSTLRDACLAWGRRPGALTA